MGMRRAPFTKGRLVQKTRRLCVRRNPTFSHVQISACNIQTRGTRDLYALSFGEGRELPHPRANERPMMADCAAVKYPSTVANIC